MSRECQIVRILQARVAAGDARPEERAQIDAHLRSCKICAGRRPTSTPRRRHDEARTIKTPPSAPAEPVGTAARARPVWQRPALLALPLLLAGIWYLATREGAGDRDVARPSDQVPVATAPDIVAATPSLGPDAAAEPAAAETGPDDQSAEPLPAEPETASAIEPTFEPAAEPGPGPAAEPETGREPENAPDIEPTIEPAAELGPGPAAEPRPRPAAGPETGREPENAPLVGPTVEPAAEPGPGPAAEPGPGHVAELRQAPDAAQIATMQGAGDCAGLESAAMAVTQPNARAELLLAAGTCKQAAGDPESALALFDRILAEHKESPSAAAAMFERGVACEATGRPGTAVGAFATYRREYPSAPRVAEALFRLCRLHIGGRRFEQAIACARRFRDRYPSDEHVDQTHYLEGLALKEQTETLVPAAESFARYAAGSDTEHLDDALYWRASCLRDAKEAGQADAARAYLQRLPAGKHAAEVRGWLGGGG